MSILGSRASFDSAKRNSNDEAIRNLADGLSTLATALEHRFRDIERKIDSVEVKVRRIK